MNDRSSTESLVRRRCLVCDAEGESIEPTLNDADARLTVSSGSNNYAITVASSRDTTNVKFTLARSSTGTTTRSCSTGTADKGGCSAQSAGTW